MIDHNAACDLLQAVIAAWMRDALGDERELWRVARFLEVTPSEARRMAETIMRRESTGTRRRRKPATECHVTYPAP